MEPMSLQSDHAMPPKEFSSAERQILVDVARRSIENGLETGHAFIPNPADYPLSLQQNRACFVTLLSGELLRGCIGTLDKDRPLILAVAQTAYSAAFRDPRMPHVNCEELDDLTISLSILSDLCPIAFDDEPDLLSKIRPNIDGLLLRSGYNSGTLLPSVWESIADPVEFLQTLKTKAGLNPFYWSEDLEVDYYTTESFSG